MGRVATGVSMSDEVGYVAWGMKVAKHHMYGRSMTASQDHRHHALGCLCFVGSHGLRGFMQRRVASWYDLPRVG